MACQPSRSELGWEATQRPSLETCSQPRVGIWWPNPFALDRRASNVVDMERLRKLGEVRPSESSTAQGLPNGWWPNAEKKRAAAKRLASPGPQREHPPQI